MRKNMPMDNLSFLQRLAEYGIFGYLWLLVISIWGGTVRYISDIKRGNKPSFISWLYEACVSGFVGIITAMTCQYYQLDFLLTSAITGIAAHNGTRTLYVLAEIIKKNMTSHAVNELDPLANQKLMAKKESENGTNN